MNNPPFSLSSVSSSPRYLQSQQLNIQKTLERLSSGLRVNRAADDPVGISLAKKLDTQLIGQGQVLANLRNGILLTATAEDGARKVLEGLNQIRTLALENLNDTVSSSDRERLQERLKDFVSYIDSVARSTRFNQRSLLNGDASPSVLFRAAESEILLNKEVTDTSTNNASTTAFITAVNPDADVSRDSVISFRLFDTGADFAAGLEIRSSELGLITVTDNYLAFPNTYRVPTEATAGAPTVRVSLADLGYNQPEPLTLNEYQNVSLQALVDNRRIRAVSYGNLDVTLGGVTYAGVFNVQPNQTLEEVVNGLNGATVGAGTLSASYNTANQRVTVQYTNQRTLTELTNQSYTPTIPAASGGPVSSFAALGSPGEGPAYRDPAAFLPTTPFNKNAQPAGTVFPALPAALNTAFNFSGTNSSILNVLGLSNRADSGEITDYTAEYRGVTLATGNQSEFVNRTQVNITSVSSENQVDGQNTGLTAADADTRLEVLSTAQVDVAAFGAGDFQIDFGANGVYTFAGFDPASVTIQDLVDDINAYATTTGADVSASFDANTNQLAITNTPRAKVNFSGFVPGDFQINFGTDNGIFDTANALGGFDPNVQTIADVVNAINDYGVAQGVDVSASYDANTDQLTLVSQVAAGLSDNQIVFEGVNGAAFADFFNLTDNLAGGATVSETSSSDIDQGDISAAYDISGSDVTTRSLNALATPEGNNQIVFSGANAANIQAFFRLNNVTDNGSNATRTSSSAGDISSQAIDPSLDIQAADVGTRTLTELLTPRLSPFSGNLRINGQTLLAVNGNTTLNQLVQGINNFSASNGRDYTATFDVDVAGGLAIRLRDTENLTAPGSSLGADPGGNAQVNANEVTLDSSAFIAEAAPLSYNNGVPLGSGAGPAEQLTFQSTSLSPQYLVNGPDPSTEDISGIQFSGSNIARVLHLQDVGTGTPTAVANTDLYRGVITATGSNTYNLAAEYQRDFTATSETTSTRSIGFETPIGQQPDFGIVGEIFVRAAQSFVTEDNALGIQSGVGEGQPRRLEIRSLTAESLRLETLGFIGQTEEQTRLLGLEALKVLDEAIDQTLTVVTELGVQQRGLEQRLLGASLEQENLQQALSQVQDADIPEEIGNLTRSQINAQAASFALQAQREIQQQNYDLLLNPLKEISLRDF